MSFRGWGKQTNKSKEQSPDWERGKKKERKKKKKKREREYNEIKFLSQLIRVRAKVKWSEKAGEHSMGFKVLTSSEKIGDPLESYSNNHVFQYMASISTSQFL